MTDLEKIAEQLARALGHHPNCKSLRDPDCDCEAGYQQAEALDAYEYWKKENLKRG